ncbi:MAG: phenylalanine--tRNA ligase beta subunit-related protein [Bacteroides sp.]|nr:phenylalanine--tRNA ligase beta subunit-related protein [Roseburia sp.]MCM1347042.1 phenylalanine--tRNA ligase beta subunit-related protein [Bacteroides sp.]MCM1420731.1 phenylalanine--tRNA ligase beta subunit-related protein [Bacteroides sp.]
MEHKKIVVLDELRAACPAFVGAAVYAELVNTEYSSELWVDIENFVRKYRECYDVSSIKQMPSIEATRLAYRKCGKDPSRYRPSGEALVRRVLQGKELYHVDTAVDLVNLASIAYGYSIGGFDYDKIVGSTLELGVGCEGEPYEGIGRGMLNICGMPVYRDSVGGIGTPTSDNERTKMSLSTTRILALVNGYDGNRENVRACALYIQDLLRKYAMSDGGEIVEFGCMPIVGER